MFILRDDGELYYNLDEKMTRVSIKPCFPDLHQSKYLSIRDNDNKEVHFIEDSSSLETDQQKLIHDILEMGKKKIEVISIELIEEEIELRVFNVLTTAGKTKFYTKLEDWPVKISDIEYKITDIHEDSYFVNTSKLDKKSLKKISSLID